MLKVAVYGKGGIGKSTVTSNLAAAFANMGKRVIQIGCDPKADSTINLLGGEPLRPVMNYMREEDEEPDELAQISKEGYGGILCIETGGPTPGLGCAGRGIITALEKLKELGAYDVYKPDVVLYDVLGDVVCGGFSMPMRGGYADKIFIITSGENMAIHAAANIGTLSHSGQVALAEEQKKTLMECYPTGEMADEYRALAMQMYRICGGILEAKSDKVRSGYIQEEA